MTRARRIVPVLVLLTPALACSDSGGDDGPLFTTTANNDESGDSAGTDDEVGDMDGTTDGTTDGTDGTTDGTTDDGTTDDGTTDDGTTDDGTDTTGGECMTPPDQVGTSCGQDSANYGSLSAGESAEGLPTGVIYLTDNGPGDGYEDWYRFEFPVDPGSPRPTAGTAHISFAVNDNEDYRFELFRDCGAEVYGQGLASDFGSNAPPLTEWSFNDLDPGMLEQADYLEMVDWPTTVWVRVTRFTNDETCSMYQLQASRE